ITKEFFYFLIALITFILINKKSHSTFFLKKEKIFCNTLIFASIFSIGITMISVVSIQFCYVMPANILIWLVFIYTFSKINGKKQFLYNLIDKI
ncbi:MAG: hypothetical protein ACRC5H_09170, partial [Treponemataceae bacterium]